MGGQYPGSVFQKLVLSSINPLIQYQQDAEFYQISCNEIKKANPQPKAVKAFEFEHIEAEELQKKSSLYHLKKLIFYGTCKIALVKKKTQTFKRLCKLRIPKTFPLD